MLVASEITRFFGSGRNQVRALRGVSLTATPGALVAVRGRSGSGKTTLLNILGGLDLPTSGTVRVQGRDLAALSPRQRVLLRRQTVGFVFQSFGLIPFLSAAENASVPLRISGADPAERAERVSRVIELVGLADHAEHRPAELSGGQQQRVAIARALAQSPRILIADEPTGHLDSQHGLTIWKLLRRIADSEGTAIVVSSHDRRVGQFADLVLDLRDGLVAEPDAESAPAAASGAASGAASAAVSESAPGAAAGS
ncbi:ABC transporter ATP-binding protein [Actinospica durhamensis]|uniref:ABC transporter ATP-binding protein n=1 Tax=Actinospica durhamensis TaxID=1508375 RepID=A0A941IUW3_9ACTN|nr:ABC transporter ATP-binding protein [Actinospica durhamensis]